LATSAVPGLDVAGARSHTAGAHGDFDAALLTGRDGRTLIIRIPTSQSAENEQSADLVALRSLSQGVRSRLPFDVPSYVGQAPIDGTRAIVYEYLNGEKISIDDVPASGELAGAIGLAMAAIHSLPAAFVGEAGLPVLSAAECQSQTASIIDQAAHTGLLPAALQERWLGATGDAALWRFQPTVVNGSLTVDSFLVDGERVTGVLGWSGLKVADPAQDIAWVLGMRAAAAEATLDAYERGRRSGEPALTQRAMLYAELELARWLLHGLQLHDQAIVDDAVGMLDALVDRVHGDTLDAISPETGPIMAVDDVEAMLDSNPLGRSDRHSRGLEPIEEDTSERDRPIDD
jgi:aminoglycoside phosphotransferase (APT) family kinase protein